MKELIANFKANIENIMNDKMFEDFMTKLDGGELSYSFDEVLQKCQDGYCEDFAFYFYAKYDGIVEVVNANNEHFVVKVDGRFYDSLALLGVDKIEDLPFFKNHDEVIIHGWSEEELPEYYRVVSNQVFENK